MDANQPGARGSAGQPAKHLSPDDQQDRVRMVFRLASGAALPEPGEDAFLTYYEYLLAHLSFPFEGEYAEDTGHLQDDHFPVTVLRLLEPDEESWCDEAFGLMCEAQHKRQRVNLPLAEVQTTGRNPNRQVLKDYAFWLHRD